MIRKKKTTQKKSKYYQGTLGWYLIEETADGVKYTPAPEKVQTRAIKTGYYKINTYKL